MTFIPLVGTRAQICSTTFESLASSSCLKVRPLSKQRSEWSAKGFLRLDLCTRRRLQTPVSRRSETEFASFLEPEPGERPQLPEPRAWRVPVPSFGTALSDFEGCQTLRTRGPVTGDQEDSRAAAKVTPVTHGCFGRCRKRFTSGLCVSTCGGTAATNRRNRLRCGQSPFTETCLMLLLP